MGNGNSTSDGTQDYVFGLSKFREADAAYEAAPDAEKENYFTRRHAALMLVLGIRPRSHDEICEVMRIALHELAKDLMLDGPVPRAVASALTNCLRAIEGFELASSFRGEKVSIELAATDSAPSEPLVDLDSEIAKLHQFASLLGYLANNSGGKDVQAVFFALMNGVESIRDTLSAAVDRLMPTTTTKRQVIARR
jgi:hypothetical protein